jgi:stage II sporulation protein D
MFYLFLLILKVGDNMFNNHLVTNINDEEVLYLFIDYNYEFSLDFRLQNKKEKIKTLYDNVKDYINKKKINFKKGKVFLVVGGLVIGSLLFQSFQYNGLKEQLDSKYQYNAQIDIFNNDIPLKNIGSKTINKMPIISQEQIDESENNANPITNVQNQDASNTASSVTTVTQAPSNTAPTANITKPATSSTTTSTNTVNASTPSTSSNITTATPTTSSTAAATPTTSSTSSPTTQTPTPAPPTPVVTEQMVTLYRYNGTVESISLEDYVVGVVGAEMPASFNIEALKAQSILARTYALKRISRNLVLKDTTSDQVYKDISQLKSMWGDSFQTFYNKITSAVNATKGKYLVYNDNYIEAVYHSTSNGQTEDSASVWGNSYPYLKSVDSHWDLNASSYLRETSKEFSVLSSIIGLDFNTATNIEVLSRTSGDRVDQIKIGDKIFSGVELRTMFGLRSADFDIKIEENNAIFVTRGYGHGVGMSQYGANGMAKDGYSYTDILAHYYPGTQLKS